MFTFFEFIGNALEFVFELVNNLFNSAVTLLKTVASGITFAVSAIGFLPPFCQGAIFAIIGISILALSLSIIIDFG